VGNDDGLTFTLRLSGEWGPGTEPKLQREVTRYHQCCAINLDIDLAWVTFLDASCLGDVARLGAISSQRGGTATLRQPTQQIRRLLELVGFTQSFDIVETARLPSIPIGAEPQLDGTSSSPRPAIGRKLTTGVLLSTVSRTSIPCSLVGIVRRDQKGLQ
jgi:anti-anti-sigma factor